MKHRTRGTADRTSESAGQAWKHVLGDDWPGSGEPLPYAGPTVSLTLPMVHWMMDADSWLEAEHGQSPNLDNAASVMLYAVLFLDEARRDHDGHLVTRFSVDQLADVAGMEPPDVREALSMLIDGGPLKLAGPMPANDAAQARYDLVSVCKGQ